MAKVFLYRIIYQIRFDAKTKEFNKNKGHEAENLQKECLFLLPYHFPMEDSSESIEKSSSVLLRFFVLRGILLILNNLIALPYKTHHCITFKALTWFIPKISVASVVVEMLQAEHSIRYHISSFFVNFENDKKRDYWSILIVKVIVYKYMYMTFFLAMRFRFIRHSLYSFLLTWHVKPAYSLRCKPFHFRILIRIYRRELIQMNRSDGKHALIYRDLV